MPWFNVDDGFANSKPVLRIPRRYRCVAIGLWTLAGSWSAKELTDGFIPDHAIEEFASTEQIAAWLVRAALWRRVEGGWQFENWPKYQKTKEQVYAYRAAEAERKRKARSKPKTTGGEAVSGVDSDRTECGVPGGIRAESALPIPEPIPTPLPSTSLTLVEGGPGGDPPVSAAPKRAAKRNTQIRDDYMPPRNVVDVIRAENPQVTGDQLNYQHRKFIDHWKKTGKPMRDWDAAWRNWMRTAAERGDFARVPNGNHVGKPTQKAMGWEAAGAELLAEMKERG